MELLATLQDLEAPEEMWAEICRMIAVFFAERATDMANKVAKEKGWTDENFHRMTHTRMRTRYRFSPRDGDNSRRIQSLTYKNVTIRITPLYDLMVRHFHRRIQQVLLLISRSVNVLQNPAVAMHFYRMAHSRCTHDSLIRGHQ